MAQFQFAVVGKLGRLMHHYECWGGNQFPAKTTPPEAVKVNGNYQKVKKKLPPVGTNRSLYPSLLPVFRLILQKKIAIFDVADYDASMTGRTEIFFGQFVAADTWLHRADPRSKLLAVLVVSIAVLGTKSLWVELSLAGILMACVWLSALPMGALARSLRPFLWLFVIIFFVHALWGTADGLVLIRVWGATVTTSGVAGGLAYALRLLLLVAAASLLTLTTTPVDLAEGLGTVLRPLRRFRIPVDEWTLMMGLALRFIPVLLSEANRIKMAQLSRGADLDGGLLKRFRLVVPMVLPLFVSTFRRAEELAMAMESRCYDSEAVRTHYRELGFGVGDYALIASCLFLLLIVLSLKVTGSLS